MDQSRAGPALAEGGTRAVLHLIAASAAAVQTLGLTKHAGLYRAIVRLIRDGALAGGARLPPEQVVARAAGISLGTAQKALSRLATDGWLRREHGRGTFVSLPRRPVEDPWHFRFRDPANDGLLPAYCRLIGRRLVAAAPPQSGLGAGPCVELTRRFHVADRLRFWSRLYLDAGRFGALMELPAQTFDDANLKPVFAARFGAPTLSMRQTVRATRLPAAACRLAGVAPGTIGLLLEILTRTTGEVPLAFQVVAIPPGEVGLDVSPR